MDFLGFSSNFEDFQDLESFSVRRQAQSLWISSKFYGICLIFLISLDFLPNPEASEKYPEKKSRKYSTGSRLKKWFLTVGRTKLVAMSQLLARWKDILLHLPENRLGLRFARTKGKVGGGERYVPVLQIC